MSELIMDLRIRIGSRMCFCVKVKPRPLSKGGAGGGNVNTISTKKAF